MPVRSILLAMVAASAAVAGAAEPGRSLVLGPEARQNLGIRLARAERRDLHEVLDLGGMLREQADRVVWVTPPVRSQVAEVLFKVADKVKKGDVLARLYSPALEKQRSELDSGLEVVRLLEGEVERVRALVEKGLLADRERLRAEADLALARSRVAALRRGIYLQGVTPGELERMLGEPERPAFLPLHAPISGYVTARDASVGETVEPDRKLFRLMDISVLWAEADVFERDVPRVRPGQAVSMVVRPFEAWRIEGTVRLVSADLNPARRTAHLWIEVPNPDARLKPQMAVDVSIVLDRKSQVLAVPREALLETGAEAFVFVLNGEAFLRQDVVLGARDHLSVEVKQGLYEGDQVVIAGNHELELALSAQTSGAAGGHAH